MADDPIPAEIRDFILRHINSVTQLEALLLLRRHPGDTWDLPTTARRLYATEQVVAQVLAPLCHDGLLSVSAGIYRYDCATAHDRDLVERPTPVCRTIG